MVELNRKAQKRAGKFEAGKKALKSISDDKEMTYSAKDRRYARGREAEKIADSVRSKAARTKRLEGKAL